MTNLDNIKKQFAPILKSKGFITNRNKRIWYKDKSFYLITVELEPNYAYGFFVNMGIKFLWNHPAATYDYYYGSSRVRTAEDVPIEAIFYDSPAFEYELELMTQNTIAKIEFYEKMTDLNFLVQCLTDRRDLFYAQHRTDCNEVDHSLGIAQILLGNIDIAKRIFTNASDSLFGDGRSVSELLEHSENSEMFKNYLLSHINNVRQRLAEAARIKLLPIEAV